MHPVFTILLVVALLVVSGVALTWWRRLRRLQQELSSQLEHGRQLGERLTAVERRRSELEAVIASMVEGVAAIDTEERLISLNRAAAQMLSLDPQRAIGRPIQEIVRNTALQSLVAEALADQTSRPATAELSLRPPAPGMTSGTTPGSVPGNGNYASPGPSTEDRSIQAQAAPVRDAAGTRAGAVVVLHDVTQLRRLESVRRDFVANVSHEIKTPISAIKAAIETLIDDDQMPAEPRRNFTGIIARQAERLEVIIEDLLSLTRLEQQDDAVADDLEPHPLLPVIRAACETCDAKAEAKSIILEINAPKLEAPVVPSMLEQALVNLIDNAIKYSPENTTVRITARRQGDEAVIAVADQGQGIAPEHLPRLFERFYRTDRARSRQLGGTGLGLSIVKHIAECLGGRAGVTSQLGEGSTFHLTFPLATTAPPQQTKSTTSTTPSANIV